MIVKINKNVATVLSLISISSENSITKLFVTNMTFRYLRDDNKWVIES
jgi:hypothetical protein